jgi:hypothetical protein
MEDVPMVYPAGTPGYARIEEKLPQMVENPKEFLSFTMHFATGSKRTLHPKQQPVLTTE